VPTSPHTLSGKLKPLVKIMEHEKRGGALEGGAGRSHQAEQEERRGDDARAGGHRVVVVVRVGRVRLQIAHRLFACIGATV